jgi:DNA-directed RNA polymerase subunit F
MLIQELRTDVEEMLQKQVGKENTPELRESISNDLKGIYAKYQHRISTPDLQDLIEYILKE